MTNRLKAYFTKIIHYIKRLPQHKPHLDFFAAILSIPMIITIIVINLLNLQSKSQSSKVSTNPTPVIIKVDEHQSSSAPIHTTSLVASITPTKTCTPSIGPISITMPQEGQTVSANPLCVSISYTGDGYCGVVWAYKINNSDWSDFGNNSACLYNLPQGNNTFTLQVKSLVSSDSQTIIRHFAYNGGVVTVTPLLTPTITPTATLTPTP